MNLRVQTDVQMRAGWITLARVSMRFLAPWAVLLVACGTEGGTEPIAQTPEDRVDASAAQTPDHLADSGIVRAIGVAGTLVERALNAPSESVNRTSWQGVANGAYVRFALYADGLGTISPTSNSATAFAWDLSGHDTVTFSGNPWFGDLTIVEFRDPRTFIATSATGEVFGQRWELVETIPLW
jgi:hypothetical protein